ncbi:MAG: N-6 DNA methylase [Bacillota bacterium]
MRAGAAAPSAGRSLEGLVAPAREHVAAAMAAALETIAGPFDWLEAAASRDRVAEQDWRSRSAWALVSITLVEAIASGERPATGRALAWFGVDADGDWEHVDRTLAPLHDEEAALRELLPYLLDTYGRTTRLDVMRDGELSSARNARKQAGSFYTPADVVAFMVDAIASPPASPDHASEQWLDPACGSGVFLAGALRRRPFASAADRHAFALERLHGCDVAPQACDFAAFTVLSLVTDAPSRPIDIWKKIRANFIALDATSAGQAGRAGLRDLLGLGEAPLRLICNPPYATAGSGVTLADGHPTRALYLPFVEMAWLVAGGPRDSASLVVPLALGANRSSDHRRCRTAMVQEGGSWTLLFFDRQPHALFGEEAKTRATIAIRRPGPSPADVRTSGLLKWTSRQRASIFSEERATPLPRVSIGRLVPKLGSPAEGQLYAEIEPYRIRAGLRPEPVKAAAKDIVGSKLSRDVFVAGTAYNFLNVFRNYPDHLSWRGTLSASGIHRLPCASDQQADAVTAILCSRLAFWLWHVECDGFHVPAWFLSELPLLNLALDPLTEAQLADLGREAWAGLQQDVHCAVNRGRLTFAFRPSRIGDLRAEIDRVLLNFIGADAAQTGMLAQFEARVVSIDGSVRRAPQLINAGEQE